MLWLALNDRATPLEGSRAVTLAVPSDAAVAIGKAAVRALATTV